ncbi:MAG TPA: hypothetical protein VMD09_06465 [Solirubrobacteraceae bacterium]|nr:hypothetical protein [Solirubrobacteraceae bacterium]
MKFRLPLIAGAVSLLVSLSLVAGASAATKAHAAKAKHKCTLVATNQTSGKATGYDFATQKCSGPYGAGLSIITYTEALKGTTGFTDIGGFKSYFNRGTIHGTYSLSGTLPTSGSSVTATGPIKITGGTGAFAGIKAKGTQTCTSNDGGSHYTCVAKF